jgi:hypothetical protein
VSGGTSDQQVEGAPTGIDVGRQHLAQQPLGPCGPEPRQRHDHQGMATERVGGRAADTPQPGALLGVDDSEVQAELLEHLVLPLLRQPGRADDQHGARPVPQQQLQGHQSGLDGLAEPTSSASRRFTRGATSARASGSS